MTRGSASSGCTCAIRSIKTSSTRCALSPLRRVQSQPRNWCNRCPNRRTLVQMTSARPLRICKMRSAGLADHPEGNGRTGMEARLALRCSPQVLAHLRLLRLWARNLMPPSGAPSAAELYSGRLCAAAPRQSCESSVAEAPALEEGDHVCSDGIAVHHGRVRLVHRHEVRHRGYLRFLDRHRAIVRPFNIAAWCEAA